jgi:hypothetical protein
MLAWSWNAWDATMALRPGSTGPPFTRGQVMFEVGAGWRCLASLRVQGRDFLHLLEQMTSGLATEVVAIAAGRLHQCAGTDECLSRLRRKPQYISSAEPAHTATEARQ